MLVQVCQRWRYVVFDSPRRLDLRLLCTDRTSVTNMQHILPALPIVISTVSLPPASGVTNIISALQQHNRVCTIDIIGVQNTLLKLERIHDNAGVWEAACARRVCGRGHQRAHRVCGLFRHALVYPLSQCIPQGCPRLQKVMVSDVAMLDHGSSPESAGPMYSRTVITRRRPTVTGGYGPSTWPSR